jgi:hypothetical protein
VCKPTEISSSKWTVLSEQTSRRKHQAAQEERKWVTEEKTCKIKYE